MCHADAGAGTSLKLEAPSPTRIKFEWLRHALLTLGKATPWQKGQTTLPLTRPPYEGIKCQPLLHSARVRRHQATTPHSGSDRSPVRQLRSLLPGAVAALWEPATQCKMCSALLQLLFCQLLHTFPSVEPPNGMGTTLGSDSGLDQDKTLACRTLGTPARRPLEPPGRRRDLRKTKDDAEDDSHARLHTP